MVLWDTSTPSSRSAGFPNKVTIPCLNNSIYWPVMWWAVWAWTQYHKDVKFVFKLDLKRASLVVQWLRIRLPIQGTGVRALAREDPTCRGATKPVRHNYWAWALEPASHNYWAHMPQLLKPACLEPMLHNKRSHHSEKPAHCNKE